MLREPKQENALGVDDAMNGKDYSTMQFDQGWEEICHEEGIHPIPELRERKKAQRMTSLLDMSIGSKEREENGKIVTAFNVVYEDNGKKTDVSLLQVVGDLSSPLLGAALAKASSRFNTMNTLDLTNCSLKSEGFSLVGYILRESTSIKNLSLDYNLDPLQGHYRAVRYGMVEQLSLRNCGINETGAKSLGKYLATNKTLRILNLSSNYLGSDGATYIADALQLNRSLVYLNLCGNRIGPTGGESIASSMMASPRPESKLRKKRKIEAENMKKRIHLLVKKEVERRRELFGTSNISGNIFETTSDDESTTSMGVQGESLPDTLNISTRSFPSAEVLGQQVSVEGFGNTSLMYLNLSYNNLSDQIVGVFLDVLIYQESHSLRGPGKGLTILKLEGNRIEENSETTLKLEDMLYRPYNLREEESKQQ